MLAAGERTGTLRACPESLVAAARTYPAIDQAVASTTATYAYSHPSTNPISRQGGSSRPPFGCHGPPALSRPNSRETR